ncbi:permease [Ornatilinea apprima]|uniref:Permease n=1 Tax=Ornatilinea apprima TaxID=1134406 RepID=A0A0P6X8C9_9CHLR|nr:permease [Ornatilinea apprima]
MIGRPLPTADAPHQTIGKAIGLAVFASDALSSTAYATQEMMVILALAGAGAFHFSIPLSFGIVILLTILTFSYEQTIHAYPGGGGAYIVARDNLGELPAQTAGAALLMDYILTVAVSISSGVAQIVSAAPTLFPYRVWIAVALVMFIMVINLRGVKESGIVFSIPTYFFIIMMYTTVILGLLKYFTGSLMPVINPPEIEMIHAAHPITFFLILRAFSNGTAAVTGVEAISNGITAFREPRSKNAGQTLIIMAFILGSLLLGITFLSYNIGALPSESETVISQMMRTIYEGRGVMYIAGIVATTVILVMAANTAFADFPRLSALHAGDGFLPRQMTFRGSRLVYSYGIVSLSVIASLLIIIFQASVTNLIPLYAIGVFLSFTLSQFGMARRWWKVGHLQPGEERVEKGSTLRFENGWQYKLVINGFGALVTFLVMMVFGITKFLDGAWIVIILTPILVSIFYAIHFHYKRVASRLSLTNYNVPPKIRRHRVILTVGGVHRGSLTALRYARMITDDVTAVHVTIDPEESQRIQKKWEIWGDGVRLVVLDSPYRLFVEPLLEYIEEIAKNMQPNELLTIVVPQFIARGKATQLLHQRTADTLRKELLFQKNIVITEVPYQLGE